MVQVQVEVGRRVPCVLYMCLDAGMPRGLGRCDNPCPPVLQCQVKEGIVLEHEITAFWMLE